MLFRPSEWYEEQQIEALNVCSAAELRLMDDIGASMEAANLKQELVLYSIH